MKYEIKDTTINLFNKGINKGKEIQISNITDTIYNKKLFINILKIIIIYFIIILLVIFYFFLNNKNFLKIRKLSTNSIIVITLSIDTAGSKPFITNVVDQMPDEIYLNDNRINIRSMTSFTENGRDLQYNFNTGEYTVKIIWHEPITYCNSLFYNLGHIKKIDLSGFDSSHIVTTESMFYKCSGLIDLNLENFDTSLVTNMNKMFLGCGALTTIDVSNFDTSKVVDMEDLFVYDYELTYLDLSSFDVSQVTTMSHMFMDCYKLSSIKFGTFDTKNVKSFSAMFEDCKSLLSIDLSTFDTSNIVKMNSMFNGCSKLESIDLSSFQTSNCENMNSFFFGCTNLKSINLSNFETTKTTSMEYMFQYCEKLQYLDLGSFDTSSVLNMKNMFDGCSSLNYLNLYSFSENSALDLTDIFNDISGSLIYCINDISKANNIYTLLDQKNLQNDCSNLCFSENAVYDLDSNSCTGNCSSITQYKYKYADKCYINCESLDCFYSYDLKECITEIPEGYYRESNSLYTIEKCPIKCKNCSLESINDNNLCNDCNTNYYKLSVDSFIECYDNCPEGYINSIFGTCEIYITTVPTVPLEFTNFIIGKLIFHDYSLFYRLKYNNKIFFLKNHIIYKNIHKN